MTTTAFAADWTPARPFCKSAGGKTKLVPTILEILPKKIVRYHELFVGGGAIFWAVQAGHPELKTGWLNDRNEPLVNTYWAVRAHVEALIRQLQKKRYANDLEHFLKVREGNFDFRKAGGTLDARIQAAADFIFTNKTGFNGLFRVNGSGQFNVPFGRYDNPTICDAENLRACSEALKRTTLGTMDFAEAAKACLKGDIVYLDPPYVPLNPTSDFTKYTANGFTNEDHIRLRDTALGLKQKGVFVLLSNSDTPFVRSLYKKKDWTLREVQMMRAINSVGDKRGKVSELLIW
jgi:DNA adenine methylase